MYIHRIAIDANRINARGEISAMNALERYHDAQVIEIVQTSTLKAEFQTAPAMQKRKAANYGTIGSNGLFYVANGPNPDAIEGATGTDSRWWEIVHILFPTRSANPSVQDRRDALHVDQAMQNAVDWFVTQERAIIDAQQRLLAAGLDIRVGDAPEVLAAIECYFDSEYGTLDINILRTELMRELHIPSLLDRIE